MTDLRDAARQALEALEEATNYTGCEAWSPSMTDECLAVAVALKAALEQPEQEQEPKSTWQKLYEAAIDQRNEAVAELRRLHAENVLLHERHHFDNGVLAELLQALKDATDAIEHWGTYATDYFQKKWDLQRDINAARAAIARAEGQA
jgi:hypothetical protein